jgi:hypothetical protein
LFGKRFGSHPTNWPNVCFGLQKIV